MTTRGLASVWVWPFEGPERMVRTTFLFAGSRKPGSGGGRFRFELVALARAKEGSGDMTTVASVRRLISTIVVLPHLEHLNCTLEWPPNSMSLSKCSAPQWMQAVFMVPN